MTQSIINCGKVVKRESAHVAPITILVNANLQIHSSKKRHRMKPLVIFTSIRGTPNFGRYAENFTQNKQDPDVLVIDETPTNRKNVKQQLNGFTTDFYGAEERNAWFNSHGLSKYKSVIPERAHNESSFGLLIALERGDYDMVVFLDDDTYPINGKDFLSEHWMALHQKDKSGKPMGKVPVREAEYGNWLNTHPSYQVRGLPYCQRRLRTNWMNPNNFTETVLNMGCWIGIPDLNAIDYLAFDPDPQYFQVHNFTAAKRNFVPICSMNVAFKPQIIPAYYQLWHRDRYDDIFSGLFLKVIADHLNKGVSVGSPLCVHDKVPRDYFKDAETELPSMKLNESLWQVLLETEFTESTWLGCYRELTEQLRRKAKPLSPHYITQMTNKMLQWTELVEKV